MKNLKEVNVSPNIAHSRTLRRTKALAHPLEDERGLHFSEKLKDGFRA